MEENSRKKQHTDLECVPVGFANGVAPGFPLTEKEKISMIVSEFGLQLTNLPESDPNNPGIVWNDSGSLRISTGSFAGGVGGGGVVVFP